MLDLTIPDMTCGGCARGVTAAIKSVDPAAELVIDEPHPRNDSFRLSTRFAEQCARLQSLMVAAGAA